MVFNLDLNHGNYDIKIPDAILQATLDEPDQIILFNNAEFSYLNPDEILMEFNLDEGDSSAMITLDANLIKERLAGNKRLGAKQNNFPNLVAKLNGGI